MIRFGIRSTKVRGRRGLRRAWVLGVSLTVTLVLAGCGDMVPSTNTYPIDFFSEMHYSKAWTAGEPDGLNPPAGSVPITGAEVAWDMDEVADLENPYGGAAELGANVYAMNCVQCHGADGDGEGPVVPFWTGHSPDAPVPSNLQEAAGDWTDGELYWIVTYGLGDYMPRFGPLLTEEERWALVEHLRTLE